MKKKMFWMLCSMLGLVCAALAEERIPAAPPAGVGQPVSVCWMRKDDAGGQAVGVYEDEEKFVFGLLLPNVSEKCSLGIYWNADGDVSTGRFPSVQGVDLQLNVSFERRKIDAIIWENAVVRRYMTIYEDDYVLEHRENCFFVAIRKLAARQARHAAQSKCLIKWMGAGEGSASFAIGPQAPKLGYLPVNCPILRLQARDRGRGKPIVAEDVGGLPSGVRVWNCGGERFAEGEPSPEATAVVSALALQAARGEQEHLFFAVEKSADFCGVKAQLCALRSPQGDVLPVECQQLRFADYVANDRGEWFTDVLLSESPRRPARRQFLVWSVQIPRQAAKGVYAGALNLEVGEQQIAVPVQVEVFGFDMPERPRFLTAFAIKRSYLLSHGWTKQRRSEVYQALLDQCERMRYGPRLLGVDPACSLENGLLKIDWSSVDAVLPSYFRRFNVSQIVPAQLGSHDKFVRWNSLLGTKYHGADDPGFQRVWAQFIQQYVAHFRKNGLLDKMLFIIWDEPYAQQYHDIRVAAEIVRREAPGLPIGLFIAQYAEELADCVDVWLVAEDGIANLCAKLAPGKRKWLYNSGGLNNFRVGAADMRGYYLLAFRQGIEGFLFSESNHVDLCLEKDGRFHNLYPQHCWCYVTQDGTKVHDSWRQLLVQSGIDDYDYLALLQETEGSLPDWLTGILPEFRDGRPDFRLRTVAEWNLLRLRIARLLEHSAPQKHEQNIR